MVSTLQPFACTASIRQPRTISPLTLTVHAPHTPCSQPICEPVRPSSSRRKSTRCCRGAIRRLTRGPQVGFKQPLEEIRRLDMTFSFPAQKNEAGIQCQGTCGVFGGRVGEREAAAQRAAVADRRVRDVRRCLGKERRVFPYLRRFFDLRVSNECADAQGLPLERYPLQFP